MNTLLIIAFVAVIAGCVVYLGIQTDDCHAKHGVLVKNLWGGVDCIPVAK